LIGNVNKEYSMFVWRARNLGGVIY